MTILATFSETILQWIRIPVHYDTECGTKIPSPAAKNAHYLLVLVAGPQQVADPLTPLFTTIIPLDALPLTPFHFEDRCKLLWRVPLHNS